MTSINISTDYGFVLFSAAAIAFECILTGFVAGRGRSRVFSKEFLERNFNDEHRREVGTDIGKGGYPDMGNGRYASKLSYRDWYDFNNGQRAHYNFVEQVGSILILLLVAGISHPTIAGSFGLTYFVGRILFTFGYVSRGPAGRIAGALLLDVGILGLVVLAFISSYNVAYNPK